MKKLMDTQKTVGGWGAEDHLEAGRELKRIAVYGIPVAAPSAEVALAILRAANRHLATGQDLCEKERRYGHRLDPENNWTGGRLNRFTNWEPSGSSSL